MKEFRFDSEGKSIYAVKWEAKNPLAVIMICHGMVEHINRYSGWAESLNKIGISVYGEDHRGHGKTESSDDELGYFDIDDGWEKVISDIHNLRLIIEEENKEVPVFIAGHSMGSFLARDYITRYGEGIKGAILLSTGYIPLTTVALLKTLANTELRNKGDHWRSKRLDKLSFGSYNKNFKPNRTNFDWLSRDNDEVDKYINDPLCGIIATTQFFADFAYGLKRIVTDSVYLQTPKTLPILLYSGEKDPVGGNTKGVKKVYNLYKYAGIEDLTINFNSEGRHESLHETNREEVYEYLNSWLKKRI